MLPYINRVWLGDLVISAYVTLVFWPWCYILSVISKKTISAMFWKENPTICRKIPQHSLSLVEDIEEKTKRTVSIETALTNGNLAKCNPQYDSPLYQLPKEIRDVIFDYSCTQSPDPAYLYDPNAYYYGPGHSGKLKSYTSLLCSCKRAWLETNALPMLHAEHAFWFQRGPYDTEPDTGWILNIRNEKERYDRFLQNCTKSNIQHANYIHFFLQMFQMDNFAQNSHIASHVQKANLERGFRPKTFHITIRHSDWFNWERGHPLHFNDRNVQALLDAPQLGGVKEFKLELETLEGSRWDQLCEIIERLKKLEGKPKLEDATNPDCARAYKFVIRDTPSISHWRRSSKLDNKDWDVYGDQPTLHLCAVTLTWHAKQVPVNDPRVQKPASSTIEQSSVWPIPRLPRSYPLHILRSQQRRDDLHRAGWLGSVFPDHQLHTWLSSVSQARTVESSSRSRFERLMGDCKAREIAREWESQGSLLRFEGLNREG